MITKDRKNKRIILTKCVFEVENNYVCWKQHVYSDGTLVKIGYLYQQERYSKGWNETLKDRIIKMSLDKEKEVVTQSTNRT